MILIAIGANLPGRRGEHPLIACKAAAESLRDLPGLDWIATSSWYLTEPVPPSGQPPYVNGAVCLAGVADPEWLLARLLAIEKRAGRVRPQTEANAARTLDLDLLAMGDMVRVAPDPVLPHPRMHERGFVLAPLAEIAPGWIHPILGLEVRQMLSGLAPSGRVLL